MKIKLFLLSLFMGLMVLGCQTEDKTQTGSIAVSWQLEDAYNDARQQKARLVIYNRSEEEISLSDQALWFNSMKAINTESVSAPFRMEHMNGDLYRLDFPDTTGILPASDSLMADFYYSSTILNFTDAPSGLYLKENGKDGKAEDIDDYTVLPYQKGREEQLNYLKEQYAENEKIAEWTKENEALRIIPKPLEMESLSGNFELSPETSLSVDDRFEKEGEILQDQLKEIIGELKSTENEKSQIVLSFEPEIEEEAYTLKATPERIEISASSPSGIFYGIQTLKALFPVQAWKEKQDRLLLPLVNIHDAPRFKYRGLSFDIARNFHSKEETLKILDLMATYKMNVLHFHFTEDEGWRIEIPELPELTKIGSNRSAYFEDGQSIQPSYGSGVGKKGKQYLSKADFIEILKYAADRHISVLPEIETPGHARAAIKAMDARYDSLMNEGQEKEAEALRLRDPDDQSVYRSPQAWNDNVMNVALPSTYRFLGIVMDALKEMYEEAGLTLERIHLGTDEVPKGAWEKSPVIQHLMDSLQMTSVFEVWPYYVKKVKELAAEKGLQIAGWEEMGMVNKGQGMQVNPDLANQDIQLNVWNNVMGGGHEDLAYRLANKGYQVVYTSAHNFYFDLAWDKSYFEPGHSWAGVITLKKSFGFIPLDFFKNQEYNIRDQKIKIGYFNNKEKLTQEGKSNIIGLEAALWSEKIDNDDRLEYMLFPRLLALAEKAWTSEQDWEKVENSNWQQDFEKDWLSFAQQVNLKELEKLNFLNGGYHYRIPRPGIKIEKNVLVCNVPTPNWKIHYTIDGSEPMMDSPQYTEPIPKSDVLKLKVFNAEGRGGETYLIE